jgi:hypothetical protein
MSQIKIKANNVKQYEKKPRLRRGTKLQIESPIPKRRKDENVFVNESFIVPIVRKKSDGYKPYDENGTIVYKRFGYNEEYTPFTKLFLKSAAKNKIKTLSLRAKEMFLHISYNLPVAQNKIELNKEKYCKIYDIKATTFSNTRMELMEAHIILDVKKEKDMYWINPYYIYNGSRLNAFQPFLKLEYNYTGDNYEEILENIKKEYWEQEENIEDDPDSLIETEK